MFETIDPLRRNDSWHPIDKPTLPIQGAIGPRGDALLDGAQAVLWIYPTPMKMLAALGDESAKHELLHRYIGELSSGELREVCRREYGKEGASIADQVELSLGFIVSKQVAKDAREILNKHLRGMDPGDV